MTDSAQIQARKPVLLVVDDSEPLRKALNVALQREGFDVWLAADGREAIEVCKHHPEAELLLMDVQMPGISGPEALEAIRRTAPHVRCCFMTGDAGAYSDDELRRHGADRVFAKPFGVTEVARYLRQLLSSSRSPRAA